MLQYTLQSIWLPVIPLKLNFQNLEMQPYKSTLYIDYFDYIYHTEVHR